VPLLFTNNTTNTQRLFGIPNPTPYVKDGINNLIVHGDHHAVNPDKQGTKACPHYHVAVPAGGSHVILLRLTEVSPTDLARIYGPQNTPFGSHFDTVLQSREQEADEFYATVIPTSVGSDAASVMRQGPGGHAVEQAVLPLRCGQVAQGARLGSI
jgi:hypothetical protein